MMQAMKSLQSTLLIVCFGSVLAACASTPEPECVIDTPDTRRAAQIQNNVWLKQGIKGQLTGADRTDGKARLVDTLFDHEHPIAIITNRWGLRCRMLFSRDAKLGALSDCEPSKDSWGRVKVIENVSVKTNPIELSCRENKQHETCRGRYVINVNGKPQQHTLRILRPVTNQ